ncbi:MAG: tRNA (adenosine(37)-N6)-threonylcarbamoyltransferase complex transferase subunit TsaD [Candidatus Omnitrophica bacterium]|nr:tRNA (adenosine(37)-N6)-threonylcarbamoyltransferase complex transferase subunit TsaD [Candidatus Omnitrophota bacterium]
MNILGIETSCDETGAAVVKDGLKILSNTVVSSLREHSKYGGVIPEIASRRQMECINACLERSLQDSGLRLKDIDVFSVTSSPGLIGSLLVGISFSKALAFALNKPLIDVDHIKAHLYAPFLSSQPRPKLPAIGLVVSGGHTSLYRIGKFTDFKKLGSTLDDAAGEAFDKVAKILGLGYPGGPLIEKAAKGAASENLSFKGAQLPGKFDFSFSGIKTAVLYYCQKAEKNGNLNKAAVAKAFQESVVSSLVEKSVAACLQYKIGELVIGGGVAANSFLRKRLCEEADKYRIKVYFPPIALCTDNAAMIAGLAYHLFKR